MTGPGPRNRIDIVFGPSQGGRRGARLLLALMLAAPNATPHQRRGVAAEARSERRPRPNVRAALEDAGWWVEVVWEHEDPEAAATRIEDAVRSRRPVGRRYQGTPR